MIKIYVIQNLEHLFTQQPSTDRKSNTKFMLLFCLFSRWYGRAVEGDFSMSFEFRHYWGNKTSSGKVGSVELGFRGV